MISLQRDRSDVNQLVERWDGPSPSRCICRCGRAFDVYAALDAHQFDHEAR